MFKLYRTDSSDTDFQLLVRELDLELKVRDGEDHAFYAQYNKSDNIKYVVVAYENSVAVGCGAIKEWTEETMEVKRMFVPLKNRGKGIATFVLKELEQWATELGYKKCILETGEKQPEAIQLYTKNNYIIIPNYGQYAGVEASKCFEKYLTQINFKN